MSFKLSIDSGPDQISLNISGVEAVNVDFMRERLTEVEAILREILAFDDAVTQLSDTDHSRLQSALAAIDLKYQMILHAAAEQACIGKNIAEGSASVSDHGFPEFNYDE